MNLSRREWLLLAASPMISAAPAGFRLAMCNDAFGRTPLRDACRTLKTAGFDGIELAPSTLAEDATTLPAARRRELRDIIVSEGLGYAGLHNLLTSPAGLHATGADTAVRRRTWEFLRRLIDLNADLGDGGVMVFGSGKQRSAPDQSLVREATARLIEGLAALAPAAQARGGSILVEPLAPQFSNVVNTLAEAVRVVEAVASPAVHTMFDTHNTVAEKESASDLIRRYFRYLRHVHLNEMDGRHPGAGTYPFLPVLQALRRLGYSGWVSVEVFNFSPGAEVIARESAQYLRMLENKSS